MTEPNPPETPPPEKPRGYVRARRAGLGITGVVAAVFGIAAAAGVAPLLVAGGAVAATGAAAGVWHLPRIRKHFAPPPGARRRSTRTVTRKTSSSSRPAGRKVAGGPGRKSPLGGRSRSGGGKGLKGLGRSGGSKGLGLGKRGKASGGSGRKSSGLIPKRKSAGGAAGAKRSGAKPLAGGRRSGGGKGFSAGKRSGGKSTGPGKRSGGGKGLTGRRSAGKGLTAGKRSGSRPLGGSRRPGGAAGRRKGTGVPGRRRAGVPGTGPAGRRTGAATRGKGSPRRGAGRRSGAAAGRKRTTPPVPPGGRGARTTARRSRWKPVRRPATSPRPVAPPPAGKGRRSRRGPWGRVAGYGSWQWHRARRRAARSKFVRTKGKARPAAKPRTFGGPGGKRRRTWRHPVRGTWAAKKKRATFVAGKKGARATRGTGRPSRLQRWAGDRARRAAGRARRARTRARNRAGRWITLARAAHHNRKVRRASRGRRPAPVHPVGLKGKVPMRPSAPPRPTGPRPRPRRVDPVSSGPAGARAAAVAFARRVGKMLEPIDEAVSQHLANWAPENAGEMIRMFETEIPGMLENLGQAFSTLGDRTSSDMPLDPVVGEHMGEISSAMHGAADVAREMAQSFRKAHEVEIDRIENPRANEHAWDKDE